MTRADAQDVLVVGGGLVGRAVALAAADAGARVTLIDDRRAGGASGVGAGMLAPSVERTAEPAQAFLLAARDAYPADVAGLTERTGVRIPINTDGILEVASDETDAARRRAAAQGEARWLEPRDVLALDPGYSAPWGAVWHARDGAVDPLPLLAAYKAALDACPLVRRVGASVVERRTRDLLLADGTVLSAASTVWCTAAWSGTVPGLPRAIPVHPMRGQMLDLPTCPVRLVAYGGGGYLVPRPDGRTYVGATMEDVGFDPTTTGDGLAFLQRVASTLAPALGGLTPLRHAAALRPMTPDHLPIIGQDPGDPSLWYACGHGRNGILLGPLTGRVVGAALAGAHVPFDLTPFSIARFG